MTQEQAARVSELLTLRAKKVKEAKFLHGPVSEGPERTVPDGWVGIELLWEDGYPAYLLLDSDAAHQDSR